MVSFQTADSGRDELKDMTSDTKPIPAVVKGGKPGESAYFIGVRIGPYQHTLAHILIWTAR